MSTNDQFLQANQDNYEDLYTKREAFLRYPADWVIRFHNMYLRQNIPGGRVLDYGCGSGNNSAFFIEQGYEVHGVDVAEASLDLINLNFESRHLDPSLADRFSIIPRDNLVLPYEDGYFDVVVSNQVLYYLASEEQIKKVCQELSRCLRPGGVVFFTMMGPKNYYITHHVKQIHDKRVYEITIDDPSHRLAGLRELIYLVRDQDDLVSLFSEFECITTGYFDESMFDVPSTQHWIFIGKKAS